ncbi:MAG: hypothetical protein U0414_29230 [Polyangiaceae bacterium]
MERLSSGERARFVPPAERRKRRSRDTITALHYQLATTRSLGGLEAVVLVDDRGCLVAGAGAWPACEELAAYAPLLEDPSKIVRRTVSARVDQLSSEAIARGVDIDGAPAVLCGRGGGADRSQFLELASAGIRRILSQR